MDIGERIKFIRGDLTQKEFAKRINADQSTVQNWENKNKLPKGDILQRIHEEFNVNINWFLTGEGDPYLYGRAVDGGPEASKGEEYGKPQPDDQKDGDPFDQAVAGLKEIFDSQDSFIIPVLQSNIHAFLLYVRMEKQILELAEAFRRSRDESEDQKKRIAALEEKCERLIEEIEGLRKGGVQDRRKSTVQNNMELLYKVNDAIGESKDIKGNLKTMLDYILEFFHRIDRGAIVLLDNESMEISEIISRSKKPTENINGEFLRPIVDLVKEGVAPILLQNSESMELLSNTLGLSNIGSLLCVPLINDQSQIRGLIYIDSIDHPYGFRREDLTILTDLSKRAAKFIEHGTNAEPNPN